jgi:cytochrome P450
VTDINGLDLISPRAYAEHGIPHDQWSDLRRLDRLHFCEPPGFDSFYPIVRHEHICEISKQPNLFVNRFGIVLESEQQKLALESDKGLGSLRVIIGMDPPEHRDYRKVAVPWFTPRAIERNDAVVTGSARNLVDGLVESASSPTRSPLRIRFAFSRPSWVFLGSRSPRSSDSPTNSLQQTIRTFSAKARTGRRRWKN